MIHLGQKFISYFCLTVFTLFLAFEPFNLDLNALAIEPNDKLIERIANDYSKKFCNGIAFGLSKESAMNFANKDNNLIFQKKKDIAKLNNDLIANRISLSVIENCSFTINLKGEERIDNFKDDYMSMNNLISEEN